MRTTASTEDLHNALEIINKKYEGNVEFNNFQPNGKRVSFTLKVKDSKEPGHRLGMFVTSKGNHLRMVSACWHVHGDFFDALFSVNPSATVTTAGKTITRHGGNWQDWNIGSIMNPLYYSEACDCN